MLTKQFYDAGPIQLHYAIGPATGRPLLLLHGVTADWQAFRPIIPGLLQHAQIVAMDLRGHGQSGKIQRGYALVDYSVDVVQFIQTQLSQPTVILGHSFGALIAIYVAAHLPPSIQGLILLDPPLLYRRMALKDSPWAVDREAYHWFATAYEIRRSSQSVSAIETALHSRFPAWPEENRSALAHRLNQLDPEVLAMLINHQHMEGYHTDELLKQVGCPVLVFQGNRSRGAALTEEDAEYLLKHVGQCTVMRLEAAGHNVHETHAEEIVEHVIRFLATI